MAQVQKASLEAIEECKKMTSLMTDAINTRAAQQKDYDDRMVEYQRRKGLRDAAFIEYTSKCGGACTYGGVQEKGCYPMCTNWLRLNPVPIAPSAPIFPDLGTFVCTICSQSVDIAATASRDINVAKGAISQQMSCISSLEKVAQTPEPSSGTVTPAPASGTVTPVPTPVSGVVVPDAGAGTGAGSVTDTGTSEEKIATDTGFIATIAAKTGLTQNTVLYGGIALIVIIIAIIFALLLFSGDDAKAGGSMWPDDDTDWMPRIH